MSIVYKDPKGWLLDEPSHASRTLKVAPFGLKYAFKPEYFDIYAPHIAESSSASDAIACVNRTEQEDTTSREKSGKTTWNNHEVKKKRKRKLRELNQGEIDFHEYHTKIRKIILEGTKPLIAEGLSLGFLDRSGIRKESSRLAPITDDSCLADLCEMARQFPLDSDSEPKAVQIIREEDMTSTDDLDLFSSVTRNSTNCARLVTLMGQKYLIPRHSSFLLSDISCIQPLLRGNNKFDVIIIDPPWENKSVKRSNRYQFLPAHQLKQIPVPSLAAPECLIVTWVTNRQKHLRFVKEELYPFWSIEAVTDWWWVKITKAGEFVFPLESSHKKPYENLVLGRYRKNKEYFTSETETTIYPIPDQKIICSIPSTLHSHKPSLSEVLKEYISPDARCLELFARNLQPGWTSWGNEVLKFQHISYFNII
ncbi:N(6)-adenine-specific methyltransferase METTL4 isoform X1 [Polypterus senegalus]|uniref:N(6)-adenine-specific methyltransferase METTL4 isoform X1 n=1 Tax=Polypterus senegalus TaxID=55291 RepID=UPI0019653BB8|nr:N(6)-adenine-specific methyltransferase METTL4 isoform X1 [Polypterus senegalus]